MSIVVARTNQRSVARYHLGLPHVPVAGGVGVPGAVWETRGADVGAAGTLERAQACTNQRSAISDQSQFTLHNVDQSEMGIDIL